MQARFQLGYRPALDGLRAIAILSVMGYHFRVPGFLMGAFGVDLFFVLSGFLITSLLLEEWQSGGRVSLPRFYGRRALRLLPALAAFLLCLAPFLRWYQTLGAMFYSANWLFVAGLWPIESPAGHLWSLAVEEQFYLVWPPLIYILLRKVSLPRILAVVLVLALASPAWRIAYWQASGYWPRIYFGTDMRAEALLAGCSLALAAGSGILQRRRSGRYLVRIAILASMILTALAFTARGMYSGWIYGGYTGLVWIFAALVCWVTVLPLPGLIRLLSWRPLGFIGRISYGLYLWHVPVGGLLDRQLAAWPAVPLMLAKVAASLAVAALSFYLLERPALRLKARLSTPASPQLASRPTS